MIRKINSLNTRKGFHFYFTFFSLIIGLIITSFYIYDWSHIHIFRHDALYYTSSYTGKLLNEGRWVNYLLYPVSKNVPGQLAVFIVLFCFCLFSYFTCYRWTKNAPYAALISLLFIQIAAMNALLLWPATSLPAILVLLAAVLLAPYMPVYLFYLLFGVLFFGTLSNFYYVLPMLHLGLLRHASLQQNMKVIVLNILPFWVLGFVAGFIISLGFIYLLADQIGMSIAAWRQPNYVNDAQSLKINIIDSFNYLSRHIIEIIGDSWRKTIMALALLIGVMGWKLDRHLPLVLLSFLMIIVHYVIIIPIGIMVSPRTIVATWLGILVILFFYREIESWQYYLFVPLVLLLTGSFYRNNHDQLYWYSSTTNLYYEHLLRAAPKSPQLYKGLLFFTSDEEIKTVNKQISRSLNLNRRWGIESLDNDYRIKPVVLEAGFKEIYLCRSWSKKTDACRQATMVLNKNLPTKNNADNLFWIFGESNGYLVAALNPDARNLEGQ